MDIEEDNNNNKKESNIRLLLVSNIINYSPEIILNENLSKNNLYRSNTNINIDLFNSINDLFNNRDDNENNNNNLSQELILKNSLSFSIDSPDFIYFGNLGNLVILALTFKTGTLIIYTFCKGFSLSSQFSIIFFSVSLLSIISCLISDFFFK